uniref:Amidohydrolase-related domain-containing protein n=1 Tax=Chromera velia CCMP2878 TaxID=1169474 RepID=A0A0G4F276_9ALVE|eukprot:Cvel_14710.t1-p1 / transcript=Cvel_14710.t1 / gene=Cvel_14710 / organism=Chromera_velia_CCMP2878 / gene_product=hypothetical protein / transcript_product=hypothetical protein / location=Cvel_scaffold1057:240-3222(-) / protein_length=188 / sequence_SO=supercontig / SO=protein_coding / is_pseudo=false
MGAVMVTVTQSVLARLLKGGPATLSACMSDSVPSCQWASHAGDDTIDFIVRGQTFDSPSFGRVRHRKDVAVAVGLSGKILWVEDPDNVADILETFKDRDRESESDHTGGNGDAGMRGEGQMQRPGQQHTQRVGRRGGRRLVTLGPPEFLTPGFIDLHIHAPQYSYTGTATDKPLMESVCTRVIEGMDE